MSTLLISIREQSESHKSISIDCFRPMRSLSRSGYTESPTGQVGFPNPYLKACFFVSIFRVAKASRFHWFEGQI